jgi:geranylgeranyl pyrophosphate synthase
MTTFPHDHFAGSLSRIAERMHAGFEFWPWEHRDRMRILVERQLTRGSKRLRSTFALLCCELLDGDPARIEPLAAAVELYHSASLVLDDVQDNSTFRGHDRTVHVSESVSNAINLGCIVRSFSHFPIHCSDLSLAEKDDIHRRLDVMATLVPLGQSMDIGWHQGWYDIRSMPWLEMIRLKTGAPFACVATGAAIVSGAGTETRDAMENLGYAVGTLYQLVDDYNDMFVHDAETLSDDLGAGKFTRPIAILVDLLCAGGWEELASQVASQLRNPSPDGVRWIQELLLANSVAVHLDDEIRRRAADIEQAVVALASGDHPAVAHTVKFVDSLVDMLGRQT